jgi:hypothetical protein
LEIQAPPPHFRFEVVVTTVLPLFGGVAGGLCLGVPAAKPCVVGLPVVPVVTVLLVEPGVGVPPSRPGFVMLPTVAGFVLTDAGVDAPPSTGPGFATPPTAVCFVFAAPPTAFWAEAGCETTMESTPNSKAVTVALIFIGVTLISCRKHQRGMPRWPARYMRVRLILSKAFEM